MPKRPSNAAIEYPELGPANERYLADTFGEDIFTGLATDEPAQSRRPLGQRVVLERKHAQVQAARELNNEVMLEALAAEDKADAYQRVVSNAQAGRQSNPQDLAKAAHHALDARIVSPPSSVARLVDQAQAVRDYQPMDRKRRAS